MSINSDEVSWIA